MSNDAKSQAMAYFSAAEFYYTQNEFKKSKDYYQKSLDLWKKIGDIYQQANVLLYYGYVFMVLGEPTQGLIKAKEAENIFKEIKDQRGITLSQIAIGHLLSAMDKKQSALEYYSEANRNFPDNLDVIEKAALFNGIGLIYEDFGEFAISLAFREKALTLFQKEKYLYGQLSTMHSLINLNYLLQNQKKAEYYFEEAKKLSAQLKDNYFLAIVYRQVGDFYFEHFSDAAAFDYYQKSLNVSQLTGYKANNALVLDKMGTIYQRKRQFDIARTNYNSSLEISRKIINKFNEAHTLFNLAELDKLENKYESSLKQIKQSIEITESLSSDVLNAKLKRTYFSSVFDRYELYINLLMKMHRQFPEKGFDIQALQASEKSRARSMLETLRLSEANFTKDANPETVKREKEIRNLLNAKADKLIDALSSNAGKAEIDKLSGDINELENELEQIKADLKQNSPLYSAIKNPSAFDVNDFQTNVLDDKTLLLEFSLGAGESYLWLIGKNEVNHFTLPSREILESRIQKLLDLLKSREVSPNEEPENYQKRLADAENEYGREARLLSDELFGQIADKLGGKRLIIVPDGKLSYFPISALPLPNTDDNEPILQTNEIVYESSAATLQILGKTPHPEKLSPKELLVFADPIFSLQDNRLSAENKNPTDQNNSAAFLGSNLRSFQITDLTTSLPRLFATQEEADSIAKIVGASKATIVSGFSANRQRVFEKDVSDYKIIHFATHGLMNDEHPELSGIVLSLFDENGGAQKGFIRLQDIYSLNLSADLVVLSACQSGIGKEVKGEGLMSLTGGFMQSGAKSVLSSLWKVDDYATAELMKNFYRELSTKNLTPAEALRNAQIKMRQNPQFKSPFYWAAFTVQGEFRQQVGVNSNQFSYLWIALAAIFIGVVTYFIRIRVGLRIKAETRASARV
ncbi:MAG: CHAT domain-containing protein [Pyrinomonadaceae bacterium]